jgi:hypothetical protein
MLFLQLTEDIETRLFLWLFFLEEALIKYRVLVEIEYFIAFEVFATTFRCKSIF